MAGSHRWELSCRRSGYRRTRARQARRSKHRAVQRAIRSRRHDILPRAPCRPPPPSGPARCPWNMPPLAWTGQPIRPSAALCPLPLRCMPRRLSAHLGLAAVQTSAPAASISEAGCWFSGEGWTARSVRRRGNARFSRLRARVRIASCGARRPHRGRDRSRARAAQSWRSSCARKEPGIHRARELGLLRDIVKHELESPEGPGPGEAILLVGG